jgi:hypothetical protein
VNEVIQVSWQLAWARRSLPAHSALPIEALGSKRLGISAAYPFIPPLSEHHGVAYDRRTADGREARELWGRERCKGPGTAALGPDHPNVAIWHSNLGSCCRTSGTWPAPGHSMSGRLRSARRPLALTTRPWPRYMTTSAACCRPLEGATAEGPASVV